MAAEQQTECPGHRTDQRGVLHPAPAVEDFLGNALTVRECDGTASQRWTVHEDGRLEVLGVCARAESGGLVRLRACAGDGALTWKSGSVGSVVNVDDGTCLTRGADESITVATCGRAGQDWTLPS